MQQAEIRVRGRVQGVGFRPAVWRLAQECGLSGDVRNDAEGVLIRVAGEHAAIADLVDRLKHAPPKQPHPAFLRARARHVRHAFETDPTFRAKQLETETWTSCGESSKIAGHTVFHSKQD